MNDQPLGSAPYASLDAIPGRDFATVLAFGSKPEPFRFESVGDVLEGTVYKPPIVEQARDPLTHEPAWNGPGDPVLIPVVHIALDPLTNGFTPRYELKIFSTRMRKAIHTAVVQTGRTTVEQGGRLKVAFVGKERAAKLFTAEYVPPTVPTDVPLPQTGTWSGAQAAVSGAFSLPGDQPPADCVAPAVAPQVVETPNQGFPVAADGVRQQTGQPPF